MIAKLVLSLISETIVSLLWKSQIVQLLTQLLETLHTALSVTQDTTGTISQLITANYVLLHWLLLTVLIVAMMEQHVIPVRLGIYSIMKEHVGNQIVKLL